MNIQQLGKNTILKEAEALRHLADSLSKEFELVVEKILRSKGRVIITGVGKSAIVAQKIVATFNSTGTQAIFMHAADAVHGDLGMIDEKDIIICISKSGSTSELRVLVPILRNYGVFIIGMTAEINSFLAQQSDLLLHTPMTGRSRSQQTSTNHLNNASKVQWVMHWLSASSPFRGFHARAFCEISPWRSIG